MNKRLLLSVFRFGSEILGKLPARGDGILGLGVKALAIADAYEKVFGGKNSAYADIFARYDLREKTSDPFVKLFFGTRMAEQYRIRRLGITENLELIEAIAPNGERLFFQEHRYGRPEVSSEFFHSPLFDFSLTMRHLWHRYENGLYLAIVPSRSGWGTEVSFCEIPQRDEIRSGKADALAARLGERLRARHQTVLLHGPPGTGKSSLVELVARAAGGRLLKIDATSLPHLGMQDLGLLLDALQPTHLLIDDFDRAPVEATRPRVLFLFERLKSFSVNVFVTANDPTKLDPALLRSGRIDVPITLELPNYEERYNVLERMGYAVGSSIGLRLLDDTNGFSHADFVSFALRIQHEPYDEACNAMRALRALADAASSGPEEKAQPPKA